MNREAITLVRDAIAKMEACRFLMSDWSTASHPFELKHECDSAGCIGGWAESLLLPKAHSCSYGWADSDAVAAAMGLTPKQGNELFFPLTYGPIAGPDGNYDLFTQAAAVAVLDNLLATGEVDWKKVL